MSSVKIGDRIRVSGKKHCLYNCYGEVAYIYPDKEPGKPCIKAQLDIGEIVILRTEHYEIVDSQ
jgi:hypothetical protein